MYKGIIMRTNVCQKLI